MVWVLGEPKGLEYVLIPLACWTPHAFSGKTVVVWFQQQLLPCPLTPGHVPPGDFRETRDGSASPWSQIQHTEVEPTDLHLKQARPSRPETLLGRLSPFLSSVSKFPFLDNFVPCLLSGQPQKHGRGSGLSLSAYDGSGEGAGGESAGFAISICRCSKGRPGGMHLRRAPKCRL